MCTELIPNWMNKPDVVINPRWLYILGVYILGSNRYIHDDKSDEWAPNVTQCPAFNALYIIEAG